MIKAYLIFGVTNFDPRESYHYKYWDRTPVLLQKKNKSLTSIEAYRIHVVNIFGLSSIVLGNQANYFAGRRLLERVVVTFFPNMLI